MRIVAGRFRAKGLSAPKDDSIRPTSDRVRESLFNMIASRLGPDLSGTRVLDLFAGTGALGLEALSRGADFAVFVDTGTEARGLIRDNVDAMGLGGVTKLLRRDAADMGPAGNIPPADLVFADPPYGKGLGEKALASAWDGGWIGPDALIVLEERRDIEPVLPVGFSITETRAFGDTAIHFISRVGD